MNPRNRAFAIVVTTLYALFLGGWLVAPTSLTGKLVLGRLTLSVVVALALVVAIVSLAAAYLRRTPSE